MGANKTKQYGNSTARKKKKRGRKKEKTSPVTDPNFRINYKDMSLLEKLITPQGKIYSQKRSGLSSHHQRQVKLAIKRARFLGLLPYTGD